MIPLRRFTQASLASILLLGSALAQKSVPTSAPIRYTVSLTHASDHLVAVEVSLPDGPNERVLQLPVWNGLYQVRDFSQYINRVSAKDLQGRALATHKIDKTTWHIAGATHGATVSYEMFANNPGPFGAQLSSAHAFFNLAEILMYSPDQRNTPVEVSFLGIPANWRVATSLAQLSPAAFKAATYDDLVDAPVEIGTFEATSFDVAGTRFQVVVDADPSDYNLPNIVSTLKSIVIAATGWMNDRPMDHYVFLYHFPRGPAGGGMEHAYSTAIDISARNLAENPRSLGDVTAHEFFHLWNVKRIRPQSLEPIDYSKENYTTALWFSEGFTSTAGNYISLRAGLLDERGFLDALGEEITRFERRPAHLVQSAEESSLDAWLEKYEYYRFPQRSVSYYNQGYLLGVMLDLAIREASQGSASLRDLFQWLNEHYAKHHRFFPDTAGVRDAADTVAHANLDWFFQNYISGVNRIPYDDYLKTVGLHTVSNTSLVADPGFSIRRSAGRIVVATITSASAAQNAGLKVGDEIVALNNQPIAADNDDPLSDLRLGESVHLQVRDNGTEKNLTFAVGRREELVFQIKDMDNVTPAQRARRVAWLAGESQK